MSVYTTELRYICEHDAGLDESVGLSHIDDVIAASRSSIFGSYPIFDEAYRATLETNIIKHYYMWEIGAETVGLFKLWLNNRMNEIMPKYNLMYEALEFIKARVNPFDDVDLTTTHEGQDDSVGSSSGSASSIDAENSSRAEQEAGSRSEQEAGSKAELESGSSNNATSNSSKSNQTSTTDHLNKYADTPQGGLSGLLNDTYLTNATKDDGTDTAATTATASASSVGSDSRERSGSDSKNISGTDSRTRTGTDQRDGSRTEQHVDSNTVFNTQQYVEHVIGKRGGKNFYGDFFDLCEKIRSIDLMIIRDLQDLFMGVW